MERKFMKWDAAHVIDNEEVAGHFMEMAIKENDSLYLAHALSVIVKAKGITIIAEELGITREELVDYLAQLDGKPDALSMPALNALRSKYARQ